MADTYSNYPQAAKNNAKRVLQWKKEHGSEVKAMTSVGWRRASQLASGTALSFDTVKRIAAFERHRENSKIDPKYKSTPWKDNGYVAWLGWGGASAIAWAKRIVASKEKKSKNEAMVRSIVRNIIREEIKDDMKINENSEKPTIDTFAELAWKSKNWNEFKLKLHQGFWGLTTSVLLDILNLDMSMGKDKLVATIKKQYFAQKRRWKGVMAERKKEADRIAAEYALAAIMQQAMDAEEEMQGRIKKM